MEPDIASVAALIGEPARATMLLALMDGRAFPAGELAFSRECRRKPPAAILRSWWRADYSVSRPKAVTAITEWQTRKWEPPSRLWGNWRRLHEFRPISLAS